MNLANNRCLNCTLKSDAVAVLSDEELHVYHEACSLVIYKKGEMIFKEGTPTQSIAYLRDGYTKLCKKGFNEKDFILGISKKGAYLGIQNLNRKNKKNYYSAVAITDSEICFINIERFKYLFKQNETFAEEVITCIFNDEMNYFDRLVNNIQQQLPGRLANTLIYFKEKLYNENPFKLNLTKAELGSLIGTSRESVSRILKEFQNANIIKTDKNLITIIDQEKLEQIKIKG